MDPHYILHRLWFKDCYFAVGGVPSSEEFRGCCERLLLPIYDDFHRLDCNADYVAIKYIYDRTLSDIFGHYESY